MARLRAVSLPSNGVGVARHGIYKGALTQIKCACEQGFYLEAITLLESLISDRLESRLNSFSVRNFSYETLGILIDGIRKYETDDELRNIVLQELDSWRKLRNKSLHEMVKMDMADVDDWATRVIALVPIPQSGLSIFRKIDRRCEKLKKLSISPTSIQST